MTESTEKLHIDVKQFVEKWRSWKAVIRERGEARASASVALIFRIRPSPQARPVPQPKLPIDLQDWLQESWVQSGTLELMFIKRAFNPRDRWSGHVAFPGGRKEANETSLDAAKREVLEEMGLDLSSSKYAYLGQLDDRFTTVLRGTTLHVSAFGFMQLTPTEDPPKMASKEVADSRFVEVAYFAKYRPQQVSYQLFNLSSSSFDSSWLGRTLKNSTYYFPGILLPPFPSEDQIKLLNSPTLGSAVDVSPLSQETTDGSVIYVLWGMTLEICDDCFAMLGVTRRNNLTAQRYHMVSDVNASDMLASFMWRILTLPPAQYQLVRYGAFSFVVVCLAGVAYLPFHFLRKARL